MNDSHRKEVSRVPVHDWGIEVMPETAVARRGAKRGDDQVDWERSTLKITLQGSLQGGYDLSDAIVSAATFYSNISVRDRRSDPASAQKHADLARRMSGLAAELEAHLNRALNALDDNAAIELVGNE